MVRERLLDVLEVEQRQGRCVLGGADLVGVARVLFLDVGRVRQQHPQQAQGWRCGEGRPSEALAHQQRQDARVVDVGMGEDDGVERRRLDRERRPVAQAQVLGSLEHARVDQHLLAVRLDQVTRPRDGAGSPQEREVDHAPF